MKTGIKTTLTTLSLLAFGHIMSAQEAAGATQMAEELPIDHSTSFWILVVIGVCLFLGIMVYGFAISAYAKSGMLNKVKDGAKSASAILLLLLPGMANAQSGGGWTSSFSDTEVYMLIALDSLLLIIFLYLRQVLKNLTSGFAPQPEAVEDVKPSAAISQVLTKVVPIDQEASILMDHDYDGIQELDNSLPPWWLWGFYISIAFGVVYLFHYHVFQTGDLAVAVLKQDQEQAIIDRQIYLESLAMSVDESSVTLLTDAGDLASGAKIFKDKCVTCHGPDGQGLVGPNFTDDYWLYGDDVKSIFKTVKYGAKRGMKAWSELNPQEMAQVSSFIVSLRGTDPPNQKDPEGDYYAPGGNDEGGEEESGDAETNSEQADSTAVEMPSVE